MARVHTRKLVSSRPRQLRARSDVLGMGCFAGCFWLCLAVNAQHVLWTFQIGTSDTDICHDAHIDSYDNFVLTGHTGGELGGNTNAGSWDMAVIKLDSHGLLQWIFQSGTSKDDVPESVGIDDAGNIAVVGRTEGQLGTDPYAGSHDIFVVKLDSAGSRLWTYQGGTSGSDIAFAVVMTALGDVVTAGQTYGGLDGNSKRWQR